MPSAQPVSATSAKSVQSVIENLAQTGRFPTLPHVAMSALSAAQEPDADADDVCEIIRSDVGLTASILRLANSVVYARRTHARTLREAVMTLGLRKTCDLMVAAGARQVFGGAGRHAATMWNHALAVGLAAETLAKATKSADAGVAFLTGLFHDVGRIVILMADPHGLDDLKNAADDGSHLALEVERYGADHAALGADLAETWTLSPTQCLALRWHHQPDRVAGITDLPVLVNAADAVAYRIGVGFGAMPPDGVALESLQLSPEDEGACIERVTEAYAQYLELLTNG